MPPMRDTQVVVDGFVDSDECWKALNGSDQNLDGRVDPEEYVLFAQDLEPGVIDDVTSYDQLPTAFQASFTATACLCNNPLAGGNADATDCCLEDQAHIRIPVAPSQSPNATEVNYLYTACALTSGAAEIVETTPTKTPTVPFTPAPSPPPSRESPPPSREKDNDDELVPSMAPTPFVERVISLIPYSIALMNGQTKIQDMLWTQEYLSNLITALNVLSVQVARDTVTIIRPTGFDAVNDIPCPSNTDFDDTTTLCQQVTAKVRLAVRSPQDQQVFDSDLISAIEDGALQAELDRLLWEIAGDDPVIVLESYETEERAGEIESSNSLSSGAIAGICIAGLFFALLPIGMYILRRHTPIEDKPPYQEYEPDIEVGSSSRDGIGSDPGLVPKATSGGSQTNIYSANTLGAATADYGKGSAVANEAPGGFVLEDDDDDDDEASSSNAGSSGWSSSAGISSLNTGSMDDSADAAVAAGATLAGIGVASAFSRHQKKDSAVVSDTDDGGNTSDAAAAFVSRDQLDQLIEAGDWAAVGATAALLAAASDSQSAQSMPRSGSMRSHQSADAGRAAELDQLVDAGDWEGAFVDDCALFVCLLCFFLLFRVVTDTCVLRNRSRCGSRQI